MDAASRGRGGHDGGPNNSKMQVALLGMLSPLDDKAWLFDVPMELMVAKPFAQTPLRQTLDQRNKNHFKKKTELQINVQSLEICHLANCKKE